MGDYTDTSDDLVSGAGAELGTDGAQQSDSFVVGEIGLSIIPLLTDEQYAAVLPHVRAIQQCGQEFNGFQEYNRWLEGLEAGKELWLLQRLTDTAKLAALMETIAQGLTNILTGAINDDRPTQAQLLDAALLDATGLRREAEDWMNPWESWQSSEAGPWINYSKSIVEEVVRFVTRTLDSIRELIIALENDTTVVKTGDIDSVIKAFQECLDRILSTLPGTRVGFTTPQQAEMAAQATDANSAKGAHGGTEGKEKVDELSGALTDLAKTVDASFRRFLDTLTRVENAGFGVQGPADATALPTPSVLSKTLRSNSVLVQNYLKELSSQRKDLDSKARDAATEKTRADGAKVIAKLVGVLGEDVVYWVDDCRKTLADWHSRGWTLDKEAREFTNAMAGILRRGADVVQELEVAAKKVDTPTAKGAAAFAEWKQRLKDAEPVWKDPTWLVTRTSTPRRAHPVPVAAHDKGKEKVSETDDDDRAKSSGDESGGNDSDQTSVRERMMSQENALLRALDGMNTWATQLPWGQQLVAIMEKHRLNDKGRRDAIADAWVSIHRGEMDPHDTTGRITESYLEFAGNLHKAVEEVKNQLTEWALRLYWRPGDSAGAFIRAVGKTTGSAANLLSECFAVTKSSDFKLATELLRGNQRLFLGELSEQLTQLAAEGLAVVRQANNAAIRTSRNNRPMSWGYRVDGPDQVLVVIGSGKDVLVDTLTDRGFATVLKSGALNLKARLRDISHGGGPGYGGELRLTGAPSDTTIQQAIRKEILENGTPPEKIKRVFFYDSVDAEVADPAAEAKRKADAARERAKTNLHPDLDEGSSAHGQLPQTAKRSGPRLPKNVEDLLSKAPYHSARLAFDHYLVERRATENADFLYWVTLEYPKSDNRTSLFMKIYCTFIDVGDGRAETLPYSNQGRQPLNLESDVQEALAALMESCVTEMTTPSKPAWAPAADAFDQARRQTREALNTGLYYRFRTDWDAGRGSD